MDFAWLAVIGILLLVAGLSALGFDSLRRRRSSKQFDFPELETTLLSETEGLPITPTPAPGQARSNLGGLLPKLNRLRLPSLPLRSFPPD